MKVSEFAVLLVTSLVTLAPLPAIAQTQTIRFQCGEGGAFEAHLHKTEAKVKLPSGETKELLPVDSRIGKKYSDGRMMLFVDDTEAWIEVNYTRVLDNCLAEQSSPTVSSSN